MRTVATESSRNDKNWIEKALFSTTYFTGLREQQRDIAQGNESVTTKMESDTLCTQKVSLLLFSTLTACIARTTRASKSHYSRGSKFEDILTLTKEAIVLICDSMGRSEILG